MSKVVDATLRFVDKFTSPFNKAVENMERGQKQAKRLGKEIQKTGEHFTNAGEKMSIGFTAPVVAAGIACFNAASDMDESMNKVDVAFGRNSVEIKNWSDTTLEKFGIAKGTALDMAATYGDMATGMGLGTGTASKMSQSLVGLAGDLASFKNISLDTANTALRGIFTGEGESLKGLGIIMTDTTLKEYALAKGYKQKYADMSQAEKVQLRYNYVMDMAKNAQGDFARTSDGAANQQRILTESIKEQAANIGQKLLPMGTKLITNVNGLINKFSGLSDEQQNTILKVVGFVAAAGPFLLIIGKLTTGVGKLISNTKNIIKFMKLFTAENIKAKIALVQSRVATAAETAAKIKNRVATVAVNVANKAAAAGTWLMTAAQKALNFAFVSSPIGWVVLGIGALIAVGVLLYKNWDTVKAKATELWGHIKGVFGGIGEWFGGIWEGVKTGFKSFINFLIGGINKIPEALNSMKISVPDWVPGIGGKTIGFNIPSIPLLAKGTSNWQGGLAVTQDRGGEIMDLPRGTRVYPNDKSVRMARQEGSRNATKSIIINKIADKIEFHNNADMDTFIDKLADKLQKIVDNGGGEVFA